MTDPSTTAANDVRMGEGYVAVVAVGPRTPRPGADGSTSRPWTRRRRRPLRQRGLAEREHRIDFGAEVWEVLAHHR